MGRRILVVEDDVDLVDSLRAVLEDEGHQVLTAADGSAALAVCDEQPDDLLPSVALIDLNLGCAHLSGAPLLQALRDRLGGRTLLILLSGEADLAHRATQLGADGSLEKPFAIETLLDLLDRLGTDQHAPEQWPSPH